MRLAILATKATETNLALATAATRLGAKSSVMTPAQALQRLRAGDAALGRLDVLPTLEGVEEGLWHLRLLERRGVRVLNPAAALVAAHDKLATARVLAAAGIPHPPTGELVPGAGRRGDPAPPVVLKPRFGSWGRDVFRCDDARALRRAVAGLRGRPWLAGGAIVQSLVPPRGHDLRLVIAAGTVVGAVRRVAAAGEWRTNVALGARREPGQTPPAARALAVAAAAAVGADLVGVDLLPVEDGWTVLELNGAVDFTGAYAPAGDVFEAAAWALLDAAGRSPLPRASSRAR